MNVVASGMKEELVWRPGYRHKTETLDINRFLSIPQQSITNDKVILLNTQMDGDQWEVAFATDEDTEQEFTFDLVYDDERVRLEKQISAKVSTEESIDIEGTWGMKFDPQQEEIDKYVQF